MSRINGDKARSAIHKRRRTAQRMKNRVRRAAAQKKEAEAAKR